ncbi:MAG TPA: hypothetical protein VGG76_05270 [Gemmatimonadaceae bacterium]
MRRALENYASYRKSGDRAALGRFIVPVGRLEELEREAEGLFGGELWRLSALVAGDVADSVEEILDFNRRHRTEAIVDVAELKASGEAEIDNQSRVVPASLTRYFEIPLTGNVEKLIGSIRVAGCRAKVRTGGVTPDAFPPPAAVIGFIGACWRAGVPFKATAGLHHPLRGEFRLTYESGSPTGLMYGWLNVFYAAALLTRGESEPRAQAALEERDAAAFVFEDDAIVWRGHRVTTSQLEASRAFAISFGSCSFREPIDELALLTRTATPAGP